MIVVTSGHDHQIGYNERTGDEYVDGLSITNKYMIYAYAHIYLCKMIYIRFRYTYTCDGQITDKSY